MNVFIPILTLAIALVLGGCVSTPTATHNARTVAPGHWIDRTYAQPNSSGDVMVIVKRDRGGAGRMNRAIFLLEGRKIVSLAPGELAQIYLPPGRYLFGVAPAVNFMGLQAVTEIEADVIASASQIYRIQVVMGSGLKISRTSM